MYETGIQEITCNSSRHLQFYRSCIDGHTGKYMRQAWNLVAWKKLQATHV